MSEVQATAATPTLAQTRASLQVAGVSLAYKGVKAVVDVTLEVPPGQLVGLIGPNGAGKTSFIDAITGYARQSTGEVRLGERSLHKLPAHQRARAGLIRTFQGLEIFDDLTVTENIEVGAAASGRGACDGTEMAIDMFGLGDVRDRQASELSQGERRLLALARAVACQPEVLLLDEPAAGLDTHESVELGERLRRLVDDGLGMLLIDHDMSLVLSVCDRIYVLEFGRIIAEGDPESIRQNEDVRRAYLGG